MDRQDSPSPMHDLIAALADGELDLRENPQALTHLAQDAQAAQRIAYQQQLKRACGKAMAGPKTCCPNLAEKLRALADESANDPAQATPTPPAARRTALLAVATDRRPVLARIGRWLPSAIAAVLLIAATVMFMQSSGASTSSGMPSLLTVRQVELFDSRHADCAAKPEILHRHDRFGEVAQLEQLPVKLADYFQTSTDGMRLNLSGVGYDYKLTGVCGIPGSGSVHIVYRHHAHEDRAISLWIRPDDGAMADLTPDRVYVEAGRTLDHPVIVWRTGGLIYYLVGDSLDDAHHAVDALRQPV